MVYIDPEIAPGGDMPHGDVPPGTYVCIRVKDTGTQISLAFTGYDVAGAADLPYAALPAVEVEHTPVEVGVQLHARARQSGVLGRRRAERSQGGRVEPGLS